MKKLKVMMMTLMMCLVSMSVWGQLNMSTSSASKEDYVYRDMYSNIHYNGSKYVLNCKDINSSQSFTLFLGGTKDELKNSLTQLYDWVSNADKKSYVEIPKDDGSVITFYKLSNSQLIMSEGGVEYIKEKYKNIVLQATLGSPMRNIHKYNDPGFGYVQVKLLTKALEKL